MNMVLAGDKVSMLKLGWEDGGASRGGRSQVCLSTAGENEWKRIEEVGGKRSPIRRMKRPSRR